MSNDYVRYDQILTQGEILTYAEILAQFEMGKINYQQLKDMYLQHGITIKPTFVDYSKRMMTADKAKAINDRLANENIQYDDIRNIILNDGDRISNIVFLLDYKAIETLAYAGYPEYRETMINVLRWQLNRTRSIDDEMASRRANWAKQLAELEALSTSTNKMPR